MDASIALILAQDGITTGAVYALLAVGLVLVFAVTQVIFIPQGEMVAYGALTIATMQSGVFPSTAWLLLAMGAAVFAMDLWNWLRRANAGTDHVTLARSALFNLAWPALACMLLKTLPLQALAQIALQLGARRHHHLHLRIKEAESIAPGVLGLVHSQVSAP